MEQALIDLTERPPGLFDLLGRIHRHYTGEVEAWARTEVDGIALMDDWGVQDRMMVSPEIFRELFKPMYREYAEIAAEHGKFVFLHSDGYITDIIPDLIEIGVDALNSQIFCMGVKDLGEKFRGRMTFWGEIDRQQILARCEPDRVRAAVEEVFTALYADGGVIAQCEFGPGAKPENVVAVFETWDRMIA
jgi:uroporphyrinogen-III decarboxylase